MLSRSTADWRASLLLALAALAAPLAMAKSSEGGFLNLAFTQTSEESKAQASKSHVETTIYNITAGYIVAPGFTLGLKYWSHTRGGSGDDVTTSGYGPGLGFTHDSGLFAMASLLLSPVKEYSDRFGKNSYHGGRGLIFDLGYVHVFSGSWGIGLQCSQSQVSYKKRKQAALANEEKLAGTWQDKSLYPYLNTFIFF